MSASRSGAAQPRAGVLGLGNMGLGIATTLAAAGWYVQGHDPDPRARAAARDHGVPVGEVAGLSGEVFVLSLPSAAVVREVTPQLLKDGRARVVIDTTTSDPRTSADMARLCAQAGAHFVDAPVSGGRTGAWSGRLTAFVGGDPAAVEAAAPALDAFTASWSHLGPAGSGNVVKLLNNLLCAANMVAVAEAVDVLAAYGLDIRRSLAALNTGSGRSAVSEGVFAGSILKGETRGGFAVGLMTRDVELGVATARERGAAPAVMTAVAGAWRQALDRLGPSADCNVAPSVFTTATDCLDPENLTSQAQRKEDDR